MQQPGRTSGVDPGAQEAGYIFAVAAPGVAQAISTFSNIFIIVLGWWSIIPEVFLRYQFGERYLTFLRVFFAGIILYVVHKFTDFWAFSLGSGPLGSTVVNPFARSGDPLWPFLVLGFILLTINHFV